MQKRFALGHRDTGNMLHLTGGDQDRSACGEADDHRMRDKINQCAQSGQAESELIHAGKEGQGQGQG